MKVVQELLSISRKGESLKRIKRSGWAIAGVTCSRHESVGEHSYGTILNSLLIAKVVASQDIKVDLNKVIEIATIHDIPEAFTSDIPRSTIKLGGRLNEKVKEDTEGKAIEALVGDNEFFGEWISRIWSEMNDRDSIETQIVLGADIIDMLVHALSLEKSGVSPEILNQFFINSWESLKSLRIAVIEDIYKELYKEHLGHADRQRIKLESINF